MKQRIDIDLYQVREGVSETAPVTGKIVDIINREFSAGLMLSKEDEVLILLAAAHGKAKAAGFSREKLQALASNVWTIADDARAKATG